MEKEKNNVTYSVIENRNGNWSILLFSPRLQSISLYNGVKLRLDNFDEEGT